MHRKRISTDEQIMIALGWLIAVGLLLTVTPVAACLLALRAIWAYPSQRLGGLATGAHAAGR